MKWVRSRESTSLALRALSLILCFIKRWRRIRKFERRVGRICQKSEVMGEGVRIYVRLPTFIRNLSLSDTDNRSRLSGLTAKPRGGPWRVPATDLMSPWSWSRIAGMWSPFCDSRGRLVIYLRVSDESIGQSSQLLCSDFCWLCVGAARFCYSA